MIDRLIEKYATPTQNAEPLSPAESKPTAASKDESHAGDMTYDDWDYEQTYQEFVPSHDGPTKDNAARNEQGFSVWEAQAADVGGSSASQENNVILDKLREGIDAERIHLEDIANYGLNGGLTEQVFGNSSLAELSEGLADRPALEDAIRKEFSASTELSADEVDRAAAAIVERSTEYVEQTVSLKIQKSIEGPLSESEKICRDAAKNPREFAQVLMEQTDDKGTFQAALVELGVESDDAENIAEQLEIIATDPAKKEAFLAGTEGEAEFFTSGDGWKDLDEDLSHALNDVADEVASLADRAGNDVLTNSRTLTSGLWEHPRNETLANIKSDMTPSQAESFDQLIAEAKADGQFADTVEEVVKTIIDASMMVVTGPLGAAAGLAMHLTGSAVSVNNAYADYDAARVANNHGLSAAGEEKKAAGKLAFEALVAAAGVVRLTPGAIKQPVNEVPLHLGHQVPGEPRNAVAETAQSTADFVFEKAAGPISDKALGYE